MARTSLFVPLVLGSALSLSATASAEQSRWYVTGSVGLGDLASTTLTYSDGVTSESSAVSFDASFTGGATIGYRISDRFGIEGELMYRRNEFDGSQFGTFGTYSGGDFASLGIGINALYRFSIGAGGRLSGYIGPGYLYLQEIDIDFDNSDQQEISFESDDGGVQLKLGGRYDFSDRWFVQAGATYFAGSNIRMALPADNDQTLTAEYEHWSVSFGAGVRF